MRLNQVALKQINSRSKPKFLNLICNEATLYNAINWGININRY